MMGKYRGNAGDGAAAGGGGFFRAQKVVGKDFLRIFVDMNRY